MARILIAGGTGLVGKTLTQHLLGKGHEVSILSRSSKKIESVAVYQWDPLKNEIDEKCIVDVDYVINLAGAGIADKRWTASRKKLIIESRTKSAEILGRLIKSYNKSIKYMAASAIGYYGNRGHEILTEESSPGEGFLSESVLAWEAASQSIAKIGVEVSILRIGIVLSTKGGALAKMLMSYPLKVGSYFGDGSQIYSWIHIDDLVRIFSFLMEREGKNRRVINAVAPSPVSNKQMAKSINTAGAYGALIIPAPSIAMKLALGEMSAVVLDSTKVESKKLESLGFEFQWPTIDAALSDIIKNKK